LGTQTVPGQVGAGWYGVFLHISQRVKNHEKREASRDGNWERQTPHCGGGKGKSYSGGGAEKGGFSGDRKDIRGFHNREFRKKVATVKRRENLAVSRNKRWGHTRSRRRL